MTYTCGLDLGKMHDYSALCAVEPHRLPDGQRRIDVPLLHRWVLGTNYTQIADDLVNTFAVPPLRGGVLVVDHTGVGAPVLDLLRERAPRCGALVPVTITAGAGVARDDAGGWRVAKLVLVSRLQVLLQKGLLRFAKELPHTDTLVKELKDYRVKVTAAGHETFDAREGAHDDLVLALALACWHAGALGWGGGAVHSGRSRIAGAPPGVFGAGGARGRW